MKSRGYAVKIAFYLGLISAEGDEGDEGAGLQGCGVSGLRCDTRSEGINTDLHSPADSQVTFHSCQS